MFLLRYGQTKIMLLPTGNYIVANLRWRIAFLLTRTAPAEITFCAGSEARG